MKSSIRFTIFLLGILCTQHLSAQKDNLSLDKIFYELGPESLGSMKWSGDGNSYIQWKKSTEQSDIRHLISTHIPDGEVDTLVYHADLIPGGEKTPLQPNSYKFSADHSKILFFTNPQRGWRTQNRGDYWVLDLSTKKLQQLGKDFSPSTIMNAKFSPDGQSVAYVQDYNLYLEEVKTGEISQLTQKGSSVLRNASFDWAYEEEFFCYDGFQWSPDGESIAYWQFDLSEMKEFKMINYTDSLYPKLKVFHHPKVGEKPAAVRVGILDLESGVTNWIKLNDDSRDHYIPRIQWIGNELLLQQLNRRQNELTLWLSSKSGSLNKVHHESSSTWIDVFYWDYVPGNFQIIPTWKEYLLRLTEKGEWRKIQGISTKNTKELALSPGDYDVGSIYFVDKRKNQVYISASLDKTYQRYLYKIDLNNPGLPERVTPGKYEGINTYDFSPNGKYAIHSHMRFNKPSTHSLIALKDHKVITNLVENKVLMEKLEELNLPMVEFEKVEIEEGVELDVSIIKPINFNPNLKYPALFNVYGEPFGQVVSDQFTFYELWMMMMVQKGFIGIFVDGRGSPALKGTQWRKAVYKKIGQLNISDIAKAAQKIIEKGYIDPEKVASWGWSGGGSTTLNLLFQYPEVFKTGVSIAAVPDQFLYDNIYQERYMGDPIENRDEYIQGSPITHAKQLEGNLLLMHGTGDDNVHYQGTERLINELVKHNKIFQVMPYPNRSHGIYEGPNTFKHVFEMSTHFLLEHCPPSKEIANQ